jgi:hypothetical protein
MTLYSFKQHYLLGTPLYDRHLPGTRDITGHTEDIVPAHFKSLFLNDSTQDNKLFSQFISYGAIF